MSQSSLPFVSHWSQQLVQGKKSGPKHALELLARWTPPAREKSSKKRRPVNLSLIIDRSGSMTESINGRSFGGHHRASPAIFGGPAMAQPMGGITFPLPKPIIAQPTLPPHVSQIHEPSQSKLDLAKDAAWSAIQNLGAEDIVSIVSFDDSVRVVCQGVKGSDRATLRQALDSIVGGGSTALFDGWCEGARCVANAMADGYLNRALLLTDGQANVGERSQDKICQRVAQLADTGVSTSAFGVGLDYNEDLLQGIALSGDGNYYHIKSSDDFLSLFSDEFEGLANVVGRQVRLMVEGEGWRDIKALNDFPLDAAGQMKLPNLMAGRALEVVIEAVAKTGAPGALTLTLGYLDEKGAAQKQAWSQEPATVEKKSMIVMNQDVVDAAAAQRVAQQKKLAMDALDRGDMALAGQTLFAARSFMANASGAVAASATSSLEALESALEAGDTVSVRKSALYESYNTRSGKSR